MQKHLFIYPYYFKFLGLILLAFALFILVKRYLSFGIFDLKAFSTPASFAFMFIYFSKEKDQDERIILLKYKALSLAIPVVAILFSLLDYSVNFKGYSIETDSWFSHSAFEYLAISLLAANGVFQLLKFKE